MVVASEDELGRIGAMLIIPNLQLGAQRLESYRDYGARHLDAATLVQWQNGGAANKKSILLYRRAVASFRGRMKVKRVLLERFCCVCKS